MCQDLHERQQAFVFGGGVYFDCLSPNVLDSRRSAINKSSMKFHRSPWFQTFQCECLWFLQVIFALTWFIVVVMGWACGTLADLLLATQQLSRILTRFFSEILSTPKDWSHRSHCTHCLHWLCLEPPKSDRWMSLCRGNDGHIQLEMYLRGCDLFVTHRPQVDLDEFCYDVCICSICKYIQGNHYYVNIQENF